jgi:hypothetical protein
MGMTIPTLDQVQAYDPQHLMSAAQFWDETAQLWEDTLGEFHASAQGLDFHGKTADATRESAARQHQGATVDADKLRQAAAIASNAADELRQAKQRVLDLVKHATDNSFMVSPTYEVTDTSGSHNSDSVARQVAAQQISADLVRYAGDLYAHDTDTATRMAQAVDFTPDEHRTIHATPYPGDLMGRDRENPLPAEPGKSPTGAWQDKRSPYGDNFAPHGRLEQCGPDREGEDVARVGLGVAGIASGNAPLGILGATLGVEGGLKDLLKCEPPDGVH